MSPLDPCIHPPAQDTDRTIASYRRISRAVAGPATLTRVVRERRLRKVLELIESQPSRSVSELALEVHLSPAHLQRLFKQETGENVGDVLVEHRLQSAAQLLSSTDLSIKEIAQSLGYGHHSSFVRAFHKRFTQAPRDYREQSYRSSSNGLAPEEKSPAD